MDRTSRHIETVLYILVLLIGAALRFGAIDQTPGNLSAEEVQHVQDSLRILDGSLPVYIEAEDGVAREPLYAYATALTMLVVGRTAAAARLTSAFFGTILLALVYLWIRLSTQNRWLALATIAALAVSPWGVSTSRFALRAVTLPVLYMAAAAALRRGFRVEEDVEDDFLPLEYRPQAEIEGWSWFVLSGILLGLSIYTSPMARIMWMVFPAFYLFLSLDQPRVLRRTWSGLALTLAVAALVSLPLVLTLVRRPVSGIESQLLHFLGLISRGEAEPVRNAVRAGLGIITFRGDNLFTYALPGKPLLGPLFSLLFYMGISLAIVSLIMPYRPARQGRSKYDDTFRLTTANAFMLLTMVFGLIPVLISGTARSTLQAIGMQPALYYFPALAVVWMTDWARQRVGPTGETALWVAYSVALIVIAAFTVHNYFAIWAHLPEVLEIYRYSLPDSLTRLATGLLL
jgi:4-amino-4-deoxy-L-arabinose transferase-like glycosyltransferase